MKCDPLVMVLLGIASLAQIPIVLARDARTKYSPIGKITYQMFEDFQNALKSNGFKKESADFADAHQAMATDNEILNTYNERIRDQNAKLASVSDEERPQWQERYRQIEQQIEAKNLAVRKEMTTTFVQFFSAVLNEKMNRFRFLYASSPAPPMIRQCDAVRASVETKLNAILRIEDYPLSTARKTINEMKAVANNFQTFVKKQSKTWQCDKIKSPCSWLKKGGKERVIDHYLSWLNAHVQILKNSVSTANGIAESVQSKLSSDINDQVRKITTEIEQIREDESTCAEIIERVRNAAIDGVRHVVLLIQRHPDIPISEYYDVIPEWLPVPEEWKTGAFVEIDGILKWNAQTQTPKRQIEVTDAITNLQQSMKTHIISVFVNKFAKQTDIRTMLENCEECERVRGTEWTSREDALREKASEFTNFSTSNVNTIAELRDLLNKRYDELVTFANENFNEETLRDYVRAYSVKLHSR